MIAVAALALCSLLALAGAEQDTSASQRVADALNFPLESMYFSESRLNRLHALGFILNRGTESVRITELSSAYYRHTRSKFVSLCLHDAILSIA